MKKKPPAEKTANAWLSVLMKTMGTSGGVDKVPEGWMHVRELAVLAKLPTSTMQHRLEKAMDANKLQKKQFRIRCGRNISPVWHYKNK
jgi:hypothetical protein